MSETCPNPFYVWDPALNEFVYTPNGGGGGGGAPTGPAGGVLSGTYPNPGFAVQPSVSFVPPIRISKRINFPSALRIRGANIVPKAAHEDWTDTWGTYWDWSGWVKPQIDAAITLGVNCIRFIGGPTAILTGQVTRATYLSRQKQFIEYCLLNGIYVYACAGDWPQYNAFGISDWDGVVTDEMVAYAAYIDKYPNIIGMDVNQEGFYSIPSGWTDSQLHAQFRKWFTAIRAVSSIPLTISNPSRNSNGNATMWQDATNASTLAAYADYMDVHCYYDAILSEAAPFFAAVSDLQVMIGETGIALNNSTGAQTAHYTAIAALLDSGSFVGGLAWAITDQDASSAGNFGLFDTSFAPRTYITNVFKTWLKVVPLVNINNIVPAQVGNTGKVLATDGSSVGWTPQSGGSGTIISSDVIYYGSTSGNDGNNGLTSGTPKTVQGALNMVSGVTILSGVTVTIQAADGTLSGGVTFPKFTGDGLAVFQGNTSNQNSFVLNVASGNAVNQAGGHWRARYFSITGTPGNGFNAAGTFEIGNHLRFAASASIAYPFSASAGSSLNFSAELDTIHLENDFYTFLSLAGAACTGSFINGNTVDVNCNGGTRSGTQFAGLATLSSAFLYSPSNHMTTSNGGITGKHADISGNSVCQGYGAAGTNADNFFPGNAATTTSTGGQNVPGT